MFFRTYTWNWCKKWLNNEHRCFFNSLFPFSLWLCLCKHMQYISQAAHAAGMLTVIFRDRGWLDPTSLTFNAKRLHSSKRNNSNRPVWNIWTKAALVIQILQAQYHVHCFTMEYVFKSYLNKVEYKILKVVWNVLKRFVINDTSGCWMNCSQASHSFILHLQVKHRRSVFYLLYSYALQSHQRRAEFTKHLKCLLLQTKSSQNGLWLFKTARYQEILPRLTFK